MGLGHVSRYQGSIERKCVGSDLRWKLLSEITKDFDLIRFYLKQKSANNCHDLENVFEPCTFIEYPAQVIMLLTIYGCLCKCG